MLKFLREHRKETIYQFQPPLNRKPHAANYTFEPCAEGRILDTLIKDGHCKISEDATIVVEEP